MKTITAAKMLREVNGELAAWDRTTAFAKSYGQDIPYDGLAMILTLQKMQASLSAMDPGEMVPVDFKG